MWFECMRSIARFQKDWVLSLFPVLLHSNACSLAVTRRVMVVRRFRTWQLLIQCFCTVYAVKVTFSHMFIASAEFVIISLYQEQPLTDISKEQISYSAQTASDGGRDDDSSESSCEVEDYNYGLSGQGDNASEADYGSDEEDIVSGSHMKVHDMHSDEDQSGQHS